MNIKSDQITKIKEYEIAIEKYKNIAWYVRTEILASLLIMTLQVATTVQLFQHCRQTHFFAIIGTLFLAYFLSDFINGLTHMMIDNNHHYTAFFGPFVAAFHLHHIKLNYENKSSLTIYFYESGHKFWLVFYLISVFFMQCVGNLNAYLNLCLVSIGILSSIAELSHFWCHNKTQTNRFIRLLQKYRLLLSMKHHRFHHCQDNTHYAFLNGMSDPLINIIAKRFFSGYQNFSDRHVEAYMKKEYAN